MDCESALTAASARLDGESTPWEDEALDAHLAACDGCRTTVGRLVQLHRAVRIRPAPAVDDRADEIVAAVLTGRPRRGRRVAALALGAATVVAGLTGAAVAGRGAAPDAEPLRVEGATILPVGTRGTAVLTFTVVNDTDRAQEIVAVASPTVAELDLHVQRDGRMRSIDVLAVSPRSTKVLRADAGHVMVQASRSLVRDERLAIAVRFADDTVVSTEAVVR